jgi:hypothetical protein
MLRTFENNFQSFIPPENEKPDQEATLSRIKDIDDIRLSSFENKVWTLWEDKTLDHSAKYKKIFLLFFEEFTKKITNTDNVGFSAGQWVQANLERLGLMGIPVSTMLRETATIIPKSGQEQLRETFNKEISGREKGAEAMVTYMNDSVRARPQSRFLANDSLDKKYAIDIEEAEGLTSEGIKALYFTQVKAGRINQETIDKIHDQHAQYLMYLHQSEDQYTAEKQLKNEEKLRIQFEKEVRIFQESIEIIQLEIAEMLGESEDANYEPIIAQIAQEIGLAENSLWRFLQEMGSQKEELEVLEEILPVLEYAQTKTFSFEAKDIFERNALTPSKCRNIVSRVVADGRVVSEKVFQ